MISIYSLFQSIDYYQLSILLTQGITIGDSVHIFNTVAKNYIFGGDGKYKTCYVINKAKKEKI